MNRWYLTSEKKPESSGHYDVVGRWSGVCVTEYYADRGTFRIQSTLDDDVLAWHDPGPKKVYCECCGQERK